MTILSSGPTKVREATECFLYEGNKTSEDENGSSEYFETSGEVNLMYEYAENSDKTMQSLVDKLFSTLNQTQQIVLKHTFGIGCKQQSNERKIAKSLKLHTSEVREILQTTITQLKTTFSEYSIEAILYKEL